MKYQHSYLWILLTASIATLRRYPDKKPHPNPLETNWRATANFAAVTTELQLSRPNIQNSGRTSDYRQRKSKPREVFKQAFTNN